MTLLGSLRRELARTVVGIPAQQVDSQLDVLTQWRQLAQTIGLGKHGIGLFEQRLRLAVIRR